ncbi:lantibiotic dehydratase C-terminal domain-containing protein [Amycolatopsis sp. A1MSW2902]|uniref:lantibiotic dehydratase C-terminal domain-containing protein n=1 Tax=Amycolatopsis sp. A1MSW2902 TaxID=687413 RepID=UPI00307E7E6A
MTVAESRWLSAHVFYHGDLDGIVRGIVASMAQVPPRDCFFLRYWEGGPHVRLRVRLESEDERPVVTEVVRERAERFLALEPSTVSMTDAAYQRIRREAMVREPDATAPAPGMYPDNTVAFLPYRPEHGKYGHGAVLRAVERHFCAASALALRVVRDMPRSGRVVLALCLLASAWNIGCGGPAPLRAWAAGRRHDGRWLLVSDPAARTRAAPVISWLLEDFEPSRSEDPANATVRQLWSESMRTLRAGLVNAGVSDDVEAPEPTTASIADHCAHLMCNRIGVPIEREARLRGLITEAVLEPDEVS